MIPPSGRIKIMDFGLVRCCTDVHITKRPATMGPAAYMLPEQALGDGVDYRTDTWSLDVVLYEMIRGRLSPRWTGLRLLSGDHSKRECVP